MPTSRFVTIDGLANFRDLGGLPAEGGRVRDGTLFRSDGLHQVSEEGLATLRALGVLTIIDLRTSDEREELPGPLPSEHVPLHEAFEEGSLGDSLSIAGRSEGEAKLRSLYLHLLASATTQFRSIVATLARRSNLPAVVHCAGGKDRTGLTVALVLDAVGVPREVVLDDFALQSSDPEWPRRRERVHRTFVEMGIDPDAAHGLLSTPRWAMQAALASLDEVHGGVEPYLREACGVAPDDLAALRENLVEPA